VFLASCGALPETEAARTTMIASQACESYAANLRVVSAFRLSRAQWETLQGIVDVASPICEGDAPSGDIRELQDLLDRELEKLILLKNEAAP
jgi:hypothetical protein